MPDVAADVEVEVDKRPWYKRAWDWVTDKTKAIVKTVAVVIVTVVAIALVPILIPAVATIAAATITAVASVAIAALYVGAVVVAISAVHNVISAYQNHQRVQHRDARRERERQRRPHQGQAGPGGAPGNHGGGANQPGDEGDHGRILRLHIITMALSILAIVVGMLKDKESSHRWMAFATLTVLSVSTVLAHNIVPIMLLLFVMRSHTPFMFVSNLVCNAGGVRHLVESTGISVALVMDSPLTTERKIALLSVACGALYSSASNITRLACGGFDDNLKRLVVAAIRAVATCIVVFLGGISGAMTVTHIGLVVFVFNFQALVFAGRDGAADHLHELLRESHVNRDMVMQWILERLPRFYEYINADDERRNHVPRKHYVAGLLALRCLLIAYQFMLFAAPPAPGLGGLTHLSLCSDKVVLIVSLACGMIGMLDELTILKGISNGIWPEEWQTASGLKNFFANKLE
jgi:hypothetical protein